MRKHEAKSKKMIMKPAVTMAVTAGLMLSPVMQTMAFAQSAAPTDNQAETQTETQKVTEQAVKDAKATMDAAEGKLDEANEQLSAAQGVLDAAKTAQADAQTAYDQATAGADPALVAGCLRCGKDASSIDLGHGMANDSAEALADVLLGEAVVALGHVLPFRPLRQRIAIFRCCGRLRNVGFSRWTGEVSVGRG